MPTIVVYLMTALLGASLSQGPDRSQQPRLFPLTADVAGFHITVDASTEPLALVCERGCSWNRLTLTCSKKPCRFAVDDLGKAPHQAAAAKSLFAFTIEKKGNDLIFVCDRGCVWKTSTLSCEAEEKCASTVSEYGVAAKAK
jgi:hypothetical protein